MLITQTPLRISLAGGGTDFEDFYIKHGGAVLSLGIDKYIYVIVKERFDDKIYVNWSKKEIVDSVEPIEHELVREAMKMTGLKKGIEITILADVPSEGSGLGSSSSITVGLLNAFYAYQGTQVPAERLAQEACKIEIDILGKPIGIQDQYIAAYGNLRYLKFSKNGVRIENLNIEEKQKRILVSNLLLFYTKITRQSSSVLTEQKKNIPSKITALKRLKSMAYEAKQYIENNEFDNIGYILQKAWKEKKSLASNISNKEIEAMCDSALKAGALGGKISGAGSGGFLLIYCPKGKQDDVPKALKEYRELPFLLSRDGSKVIFNVQGYEWK